jgi:RNA polymerase sigma-70 factor (ECF subfamily)
MDDTSLSLLDQLQNHDDPETWDRLVSLYSPLLRGWLRKYDVQDSDVDDLVQEVLLAVSKDLKSFEHAGNPGAFRSWLRTILVNRLRYFWRARGRRPQAGGDSDLQRRINQLEDPASRMSQLWNREHDRYVMGQLLSLVEPHFEPQTWQAFWQVALEGERPDAVAEKLGMTLNSVFIAKSRVLSRLRREVDGLVESSSDFLAKP